MRSLSSVAIRSMFDQETDEVYVILITIDHEELPAPIRVCSDSIDTLSRGDNFISYPFELSLPDDQEGAPPAASITVDNVHRDLTNSLRMITSPASFTIEIVRAAAPDEVIPFQPLKMKSVKVDAQSITGELTVDDASTEPFPCNKFTPKRFPGLF